MVLTYRVITTHDGENREELDRRMQLLSDTAEISYGLGLENFDVEWINPNEGPIDIIPGRHPQGKFSVRAREGSEGKLAINAFSSFTNESEVLSVHRLAIGDTKYNLYSYRPAGSSDVPHRDRNS